MTHIVTVAYPSAVGQDDYPHCRGHHTALPGST